jgi:acyl carrier protein
MDDCLAKIQSAFVETFGIEGNSVTLATTPGDIPGWDSMGHLTLASNLERTLGISFDVDEMMEMENVQAIARIIKRKLGGS